MFTLGMFAPLIFGGLLLGLLGGLYQCVHQSGADSAEAANLRAAIEVGREAETRTLAAYAELDDELAAERRQTAALREEIDRINSLPPPASDDTAPHEPGVCEWDDPLPWPASS